MDPNINQNNQINRVATPIKIDSNGVPITNQNNNVVVVSQEKKKAFSVNTIFVLILLGLLALIVYLLLHFIIPAILEDKKNNHIINRTTTTKSISNSFSIISGNIDETPFINTPGEYVISDNFKINLLTNGNNVNVLVNNRLIDECLYLHSNVALVHDLILLTITKGERNTKFYAISENGEVVLELASFNSNGMILNRESAIQYNTQTITLNASRVLNANILLDSNLGNTSGLDICNYGLLGENNILDDTPVISNYSIEYLGNHQFSRPNIINSVTLGEYRNLHNYCLN